MQTPCSPTSPLSSNPDTAVEKLQYKSFSRKSSSHTKKNKCDIVFSDVIFLGEGVNESTRKEASLGPNYAELLLNEIKNGKSPNRLPFVIVLKPSHTSESTLPMFFKNELQGKNY